MLSGQAFILQVGNVTMQALQPSPNRRAILFGGMAGGNISFSPITPVTPASGIVLAQNGRPYKIDYNDVGDLLFDSWYCIGSVAGPNPCVIIDVLESE